MSESPSTTYRTKRAPPPPASWANRKRLPSAAPGLPVKFFPAAMLWKRANAQAVARSEASQRRCRTTREESSDHPALKPGSPLVSSSAYARNSAARGRGRRRSRTWTASPPGLARLVRPGDRTPASLPFVGAATASGQYAHHSRQKTRGASGPGRWRRSVATSRALSCVRPHSECRNAPARTASCLNDSRPLGTTRPEEPPIKPTSYTAYWDFD
jgi:hypothetical protein